MDLLYLLCIEDKNDIGAALFPAIGWILGIVSLIYGVINICNYYGKKDKRSKKKFKKGIIAFMLFVAIATVALLVMKYGPKDPCENTRPIVSVILTISNIIKVLLPLIYILMAACSAFVSFFEKDKLKRKEYNRSIIKYIIIAILIFVIITVYVSLIHIVINIPREQWAYCWC